MNVMTLTRCFAPIDCCPFHKEIIYSKEKEEEEEKLKEERDVKTKNQE
jgi:hypothetical protein